MKDYDEAPEQLERPTFTLRGVKFTVKPVMPGDAFDDLAEIQTGNGPARLYEAFTSIIARCLVPEDRERWTDLLKAEVDVPIKVMTLAVIADDIVTETTKRPPEQPSPSGNTAATTDNGSTANSDSQAATASSRSIQTVV